MLASLPMHPAFLRPRTLAEEVEDDVAPLRSLSLRGRARVLESVCRDAVAIVHGRPDGLPAASLQEERSPESLALWRALVVRDRVDGRD